MHLVRQPLRACDDSLPAVAIRADRQRVAKHRWRAQAEDGADFGFELDEPLRHRDVVLQTKTTSYLIEQLPEPVLEIPIDVTPEAAAVIGWAIGNMHFTIEARAETILAPDDSGLRQMLERIGIPFSPTTAVFRPNRLTGIVAHSHAPIDHPFVRPVHA